MDPSQSQEVTDFHLHSDVDSSWRAQHHSLGNKDKQASPGNHTHDGVNSIRLKAHHLSLGDTAGLSVANNTETPLAFATAISSKGTITYDAGTGEFNVPEDGLYLTTFITTFTANATGRRDSRIRYNNVLVCLASIPGNAQLAGVMATFCGYLLKDQKIKVNTLQTSGGALTLATTVGQNVVSVTRIHGV